MLEFCEVRISSHSIILCEYFSGVWSPRLNYYRSRLMHRHRHRRRLVRICSLSDVLLSFAAPRWVGSGTVNCISTGSWTFFGRDWPLKWTWGPWAMAIVTPVGLALMKATVRSPIR
jgi:hypothetical protein